MTQILAGYPFFYCIINKDLSANSNVLAPFNLSNHLSVLIARHCRLRHFQIEQNCSPTPPTEFANSIFSGNEAVDEKKFREKNGENFFFCLFSLIHAQKSSPMQLYHYLRPNLYNVRFSFVFLFRFANSSTKYAPGMFSSAVLFAVSRVYSREPRRCTAAGIRDNESRFSHPFSLSLVFSFPTLFRNCRLLEARRYRSKWNYWITIFPANSLNCNRFNRFRLQRLGQSVDVYRSD